MVGCRSRYGPDGARVHTGYAYRACGRTGAALRRSRAASSPCSATASGGWGRRGDPTAPSPAAVRPHSGRPRGDAVEMVGTKEEDKKGENGGGAADGASERRSRARIKPRPRSSGAGRLTT